MPAVPSKESHYIHEPNIILYINCNWEINLKKRKSIGNAGRKQGLMVWKLVQTDTWLLDVFR